MKRIIIAGILFLGLAVNCFAGNAGIRETMTNAYTSTGLEYYNMEVKNQPAYAGVTPNDLVWYGDSIGGCSSIMALGADTAVGGAITTISAQAVYADGSPVSVAAQTITFGTSFTAINAPFYKFTLPADASTRNVTFNFCIRN